MLLFTLRVRLAELLWLVSCNVIKVFRLSCPAQLDLFFTSKENIFEFIFYFLAYESLSLSISIRGSDLPSVCPSFYRLNFSFLAVSVCIGAPCGQYRFLFNSFEPSFEKPYCGSWKSEPVHRGLLRGRGQPMDGQSALRSSGRPGEASGGSTN